MAKITQSTVTEIRNYFLLLQDRYMYLRFDLIDSTVIRLITHLHQDPCRVCLILLYLHMEINKNDLLSHGISMETC